MAHEYSDPQAGTELQIVAGRSIGPLRLGMARQEIERMQLDADGLGLWIAYDSNDRCAKLSVRVFNNPIRVILAGTVLNDIDAERARALFGKIAGTLHDRYAGFDIPSAGISAVKWEASDDWIDSILVVAPERERSAG